MTAASGIVGKDGLVSRVVGNVIRYTVCEMEMIRVTRGEV
jgi:hypothetical protein